MKLFKIMAGIAVIAAACDQKPSSSTADSHMAVPDVQAENLKGTVQQVKLTHILLTVQPAKWVKMESKSIETFDDGGYTASYSNFTAKDSATMLYKYDHDVNGLMKSMTVTKK
jgi:hypothetical protein